MGLYFGSNLANTLNGSGGNDQIWGFGGDDVLDGRAGNDTISGGTGNDLIIGGPGADILQGGSGIDTLSYANSAADMIIYLNFSVFGGDAAGDLVAGFENVIGGRGEDNIYGDAGDNIVAGGEGNDYLSGGAGNDQLQGGAHDDFMVGGIGSDHHDGGSGNDTVYYRQSLDAVSVDLQFFTASGGYAQGDTLQQIEELIGSVYNDTLKGDGQENTFHGDGGNDNLSGRGGEDGLFGQRGNDNLEGGEGADYLHGEDGKDTATYENAATGVTASLDGELAGAGEAEGDQFVSVENLFGSIHADELRGDSAGNRLHGYDGDDTLTGRAGNDDITGGLGADSMAGGAGNDTFIYWNLAECGDTIGGFVSDAEGNNDTIRLASANFGRLPDGDLSANRFVANVSGLAETTGQRFIYETDTGILRFDANGSNAGGVTIIATLTSAPALNNTDIEMM